MRASRPARAPEAQGKERAARLWWAPTRRPNLVPAAIETNLKKRWSVMLSSNDPEGRDAGRDILKGGALHQVREKDACALIGQTHECLTWSDVAMTIHWALSTALNGAREHQGTQSAQGG
ncbi:hypothetical protein XAB3213_1070022 [Xanthomonas citri pv. bilvae]|nr:hypothetical protein XAB3213_1070022 [Xanthomonas citri pv. bilvae]